MPIWFEVMVLMLVSYGLGVLLGWMIWNKSAGPGTDPEPIDGDEH